MTIRIAEEMDRRRANLMDILDRRLGDLHLPKVRRGVFFVGFTNEGGEP